MRTTLYGISNCNTVKQARDWLDVHRVEYAFHDFKKAGIDAQQLKFWLSQHDWDVLVNRRGTTWRRQSEEIRMAITDANSALQLMLGAPSVIKRPILSHSGQTHVGFSDMLYQEIFQEK
jgi:arsenate reductase (glutaredoxin)